MVHVWTDISDISSRPCPSGCPCHPVSSWKLRRGLLFPERARCSHSSTISMTGSYYHSLGISCGSTGTWCSGTSASWVFESRPPTHLLDSTVFVVSRYPPVFSPQVSRSTEMPWLSVGLLHFSKVSVL